MRSRKCPRMMPVVADTAPMAIAADATSATSGWRRTTRQTYRCAARAAALLKRPLGRETRTITPLMNAHAEFPFRRCLVVFTLRATIPLVRKDTYGIKQRPSGRAAKALRNFVRRARLSSVDAAYCWFSDTNPALQPPLIAACFRRQRH